MRARIRNFRRSRRTKSERWVHEFLTENRAFKRYVLREMEQNGPVLSRDLEDRSKGERRDHRWWGPRMVGLMLLSLHHYGEITVVGRQGGQRLWDLTSRWWPESETVTVAQGTAAPRGAPPPHAGRAARARRVGGAPGRERRPRPRPRRAPLPLRPARLRPRRAPRRSGASATGWRCSCRRRSGSTATTSCRCSSATRSSAAPSRASTARRATLELLGAWGDTSRLDEALDDLAAWLGAASISR